MSLWTLITGNSTLPVQPGNSLYMHLNNQQGGTGGDDIYLTGGIEIDFENESTDVATDFGASDIDVTIRDTTVDVGVPDHDISFDVQIIEVDL